MNGDNVEISTVKLKLMLIKTTTNFNRKETRERGYKRQKQQQKIDMNLKICFLSIPFKYHHYFLYHDTLGANICALLKIVLNSRKKEKIERKF